jgi:hypothetical protein
MCLLHYFPHGRVVRQHLKMVLCILENGFERRYWYVIRKLDEL